MQAFHRYLDFYIKSSLHLGLAVFALVQLSTAELNSYSILVFLGAVVAYNGLKYGKWFSAQSILNTKMIGIVSVTLTAAVGAIVLFFLQPMVVQMHLVVALVLVLIYPKVRQIGWFKAFFVSGVVSYVTVYIPLRNHDEVILFFAQRFLLLSSVLLPFEIYDSTTDSPSMKTVPQLWGTERTKRIGYSLVSMYFIFSLYLQIPFFPAFLVALSSGSALYFTTEKRSWYYTSFWVESLPLFWWIFSLLFQWL